MDQVEEPLNVLFVSEYSAPYSPGGAEWSSHRWAQALTALGHRVAIATLKFGGTGYERSEGIDLYRAPFPIKMPPGQGMAPGWITESCLFSVYFGLFASLVAWRVRADVIHAQSKGSLVSAWLAGRLLGRPVFLTVRDLGMLCPIGICLLQQRRVPADCSYRRLVGQDARFYQRNYLRRQHILSRIRLSWNLTWAWWKAKLRQWMMNQLDGVIFVSHGLLDVYPEAVLWNRDRVHVIHNLPDPGPCSEPSQQTSQEMRATLGLDGKRLVLTVGKLSPGKGTPVLLEAARILEKRAPAAVFLLAGKGEVRWQLPSNVRILGSLPHETVLALYRAAEVVVCPSLWPEPLSRTILEALQAGKPVVATDVGGTPELIKAREGGVLVPAGDPERLAEAICELLEKPRLAARLGEDGRAALCRRFPADHLTRRLVGIYHSRKK